ncbi:HAD family hydrolase [Streptococcus equinus]|uniref:HAD family hydrolase n=1 Tax=Streptococcus equinus TaxID=1335 RepID=UPI0008ED7896|nr:HAD hydrolase-like protein [Streptococcus equinus]SFF83894.1 haloacid dehalogenase superfamily, subfamily IA, variant 3 with third motif having DD or ED [Streptococcus equinus]
MGMTKEVMLLLSPKNKNIIFLDLDGVIFDSYDLWDDVVQEFLAMANVDYTDEIKKHLWRLNMPEAELYLAEFFTSQNLVFQENLLKSLLVDAYRQVILMPKAYEMLSDLHHQGFFIYAVTSNYYDLAQIGLKSSGVLKYFFKIISCIEIGFPDKTEDFYHCLLEKENLQDKKIYYLEDSLRNLKEAKKCDINGVFLSNQDNPQDSFEHDFKTIQTLGEFIEIVKEK